MTQEETAIANQSTTDERASRWAWFTVLDRRELAAWVAIVIAALVTRLWDVGGRAMHYDEILHVWYSWRFAEGMGYEHNPLTHGPFQFHAITFMYQLFGSSDVTSRVLPALFGTVLVGLPFLLRRELGRYGALAASALLLASPTVLFFTRFVREDPYMLVFTLGQIIVTVKFIQRPSMGLLVWWAALWALSFSTKESAFIAAGIFGLFLLVRSAPHFWAWVRGRAKLSDLPPEGALFLVLATITAPLWAPLSGFVQDLFGIILVNPDALDPRVASGDLVRANGPAGAAIGGAKYVAFVLVVVMFTVAAAMGMLWNWRRWPLLFAVFFAIWFTLHTSVFTNWLGFFTGVWGSLGYWIAQHGVERANQPLYYYTVTMLTYEFLILVPSVVGGVYLLARGKLIDIFLVYFAVMNFFMFSYAGERMPWLTVHIAMPAALIAGRTIGLLLENARTSHLAPAASAAGLGLMLLVPFAIFRAMNAPSPISDAGLWLALLSIVAVVAASAAVARRLMLSPAAVEAAFAPMRRPHVLPAMATMALGALTVTYVFTGVTAARAAYSYEQYERPTELLVFSQGGQETPYFAQCLERIVRETGVGRENIRLLIGEADNFAWQWRWYLRDYPQVQYRTFSSRPLTGPPDVDFVLTSQVDRSAVEPHLQGFTRVGSVHHLWWFPNAAYGGLGVGKLWDGLTSRDSLRATLDYVFTRNWNGTPMQVSRGDIYAADHFADAAANCTDLRAAHDR